MRRSWQTAIGLTLIAIALPTTAAHTADNATISAAPCGVAAGRDASNNTVTCNFGLTPEQLKLLTEAAVRGATEPLTHQIVDISKTLGVTEDAAKTLLKIVGEDPNIPEDKLAEALSKVAADYQRLQAQVAALNPDNPTAKALVDEAKPEIDAGHFQRAHELLRQATQAQIAAAQEARKLKEQAQRAEDAQMLGAASSTAAEGGVAMTERRYLEAADLFRRAADYIPPGHTSEHGGYLTREAEALYQQGDELGDNDALRSCTQIYRHALSDYPRSQAPLEWAATKMELGSALSKLGERESGTAHLVEGVAAFREAVDEYKRNRLPLNQAMALWGLGTALLSFGERESGTAHLVEGVAAFRAALGEATRERAPLQWAKMQNNLGNALLELGDRESETTLLVQAVAAYQGALEEYTRERVPLESAQTQNNLGNALERLGERESGTAGLVKAIAAYREALKERTRERVPLEWAKTQGNLGNALRVLGEREDDTAHLKEAVAVYGSALEIFTREQFPLDWAAALGGQGVAMMLIAARTNNGTLAEVGVAQIATAYEVLRSGGQERGAALFQALLSKAQATRDWLKGK
jgi:tetratricopeptide (TPR) repeat protein